jgi:hypothetical protein
MRSDITQLLNRTQEMPRMRTRLCFLNGVVAEYKHNTLGIVHCAIEASAIFENYSKVLEIIPSVSVRQAH